MIFTPCKNGLSHNEAESSLPKEAEAGCQVLFEVVLAPAITLDGVEAPMTAVPAAGKRQSLRVDLSGKAAFARQIARWSRRWELSRTRDNSDIERLLGWLPRHIPEDDSASVAHGDYRIGDIMFHCRDRA